ncbi:hypothetical protein KY331_04225 [Candidatus Woesearchaeota archaeon]|nr:hypothetical protein [Candidatus Woesearchaeota archaeon]
MKSKLDLLIIDIDDTFIYHRTVAAANRLFLKFLLRKKFNKFYTTKKSIFLILLNFYRIRLNKKVLKLIWTAIKLHLVDCVRRVNNRFFNGSSCEKMIRIWANAVVDLNVRADDYKFSSRVIKENINQKVLKMYNSLRQSKPKVVAITEHFAIGEDVIKKVLGIDILKSNEFIVKKGMITGCLLNVKHSQDKKRIAERIAKKFKSKNIGIVIQDYEDTSLLELKNLKFAAYTKKLKRFIDKKKNIELLRF